MYVAKSEYGRYMPGVKQPSLEEREVLVLRSVLKALEVDGIEVWNYRPGGVIFASKGNYAKVNVQKWTDDEFYHYLLSEVCEYKEDGTVKGLPIELCNDFYALCEMHKVSVRDYNGQATSIDCLISRATAISEQSKGLADDLSKFKDGFDSLGKGEYVKE